ncbi:hypothetical protein [Helicobacter heilmannii]|nr:hypothetical protein [Helicobacter heilmannii]
MRPQSVYKFHALTSVFFLPFALLFVLSGVAFLLGFNSNSGAKIRKWQVKKKAGEDLDFLLKFLKAHDIAQSKKIRTKPS